jgi:hypothetical protein
MTEYHPSFAARARDLCYLGAPEVEIAKLIGVSVSTLKSWRERYPEFDYAWQDGTYQASVKVVAALHKRACGYDTLVWKETPQGMMRELKHVEANIPACIFWLTNKHPEQWRSRVEHEVGGSGTIVADALTEIEAARRIAFALSKAINESRSIENGNATIPAKTE